MKLLKHININIQYWLLIVVYLVFHEGTANAQYYEEKITQDSIKISYKWRKDRKLKKDSPYVLMLQLENLSLSKVTVSFSILFYWKAQLHSSSKLKEYCIKPGKTIRGKKWGLAFNSSGFTLNDYIDPLFSWSIDDLKVRENDSCNPHLKLKLEPGYP